MWSEVIVVTYTSSEHTIHELKKISANSALKYDNGPQFIAENFQHFLKVNNDKHTLTAYYHPVFNRAAKCTVQTLKNVLKKHSLDAE